MRLRLILNHPPKQVLPVNYQYLISSWIYHTLGNASPEFANWLHENGFGYRGKKYKLFTFSALQPKWFDLDKRERTFILEQGPTKLSLSFHLDDAVQHFVMGLFKDQRFSLNSGRFQTDFEVSSVEVLPKPVFQNTMRFHLLTPLCISQDVDDEKYAQYQHPEDEGYGELLIQNLLRKRSALQTTMAGEYEPLAAIDFPYHFRCCSEARSKLLHIKGTQIRGYLYDFELTAPEDLLELGYSAGFGEKNSNLGMGMVEVMR